MYMSYVYMFLYVCKAYYIIIRTLELIGLLSKVKTRGDANISLTWEQMRV